MRPPASTLGVLAATTLVAALTFGAAPGTARQSAASRALTGYGATKKAWAAHHVRDRRPGLDPGCCFLPRQRDGTDRYFSVSYDTGHVFSYEMDFAPRISAATAQRLMRRSELPSDARQIAHKKRARCEQFLYRSAMLKRATGTDRVAVLFAANGVGGRYRGVVGDVWLIPLASLDIGC